MPAAHGRLPGRPPRTACRGGGAAACGRFRTTSGWWAVRRAGGWSPPNGWPRHSRCHVSRGRRASRRSARSRRRPPPPAAPSPTRRARRVGDGAGRHFSRCPTPGGIPVFCRRTASSDHSSGTDNRHCSGQEAVPKTACPLTATWQLACSPSAPQYWCATVTGIRPPLGKDTSSTAQASGRICGTIRSANRRRTGTGFQVDRFTNCCRFCSLPSGSRSAVGWTDLRRPSSVSPRRQQSPFARRRPCAAPTRTRQPRIAPTPPEHGSLHVRPHHHHAPNRIAGQT